MILSQVLFWLVFTLITVDGTVFIHQHKTFFLIAKKTLPTLHFSMIRPQIVIESDNSLPIQKFVTVQAEISV